MVCNNWDFFFLFIRQEMATKANQDIFGRLCDSEINSIQVSATGRAIFPTFMFHMHHPDLAIFPMTMAIVKSNSTNASEVGKRHRS